VEFQVNLGWFKPVKILPKSWRSPLTGILSRVPKVQPRLSTLPQEVEIRRIVRLNFVSCAGKVEQNQPCAAKRKEHMNKGPFTHLVVGGLNL